MAKKLISIFLTMVTILTFGNMNALAINDKERVFNNDYAPVIGEFHYNSEYAAKIKAKEQKAKAYYDAKISGNNKLASNILNEYNATSNYIPFSTSKRLNIYQVPQATDYWCGYAATKSLLDYEGIVKSQSVIANEVYDENDACPWYISNGDTWSQFPVPVYLTEKLNYDFTYAPYPYGSAGGTAIEPSDLTWRIISTIDSNHGLVVCGQSRGDIPGHESILPNYPAVKIGHWIAIDGYADNGDKIWIIDPAKSDEVYFSDDIDAYYSININKLAAYAQPRGIVW